MRKIIPAVLEKDLNEFRKKLKIAESLSKTVHVDFVDGVFVKNKTIGVEEFKKVRPRAEIEFHLVVRHPEKYISVLRKKAEIIAIQCEIPNFDKFLGGKIKSVAINPETSVKKLLPVIKKIKKVIVLTVHPGKQGRKFLPSALKKIKQIKKLNKKIIVQVDGGIDEKTIKLAEKAGADEFVVGSAIVKAENPKKEYEKLKIML